MTAPQRRAMRRSRHAVALALFAAALPAPAEGRVGEHGSRPFGVVIQAPTGASDYEAMRAAGVGTYRWTIAWPSVQSHAGSRLDWSAADQIVAELARNRIEPLPVLYGSPCFVVRCRDGADQFSSKPPIGSPQAQLGWARFVSEAVRRYGSGGTFWSQRPSLPYRPIEVWQVWNEQNVPRFYSPAPSALGYARLLEISSGAIRNADPQATVLLGGMPGDVHQRGAIDGARFLDELYRIGAGGDFDAVAVHPYSRDLPGVRGQVADVHRVLARHGQTRTPVWVTELGWGVASAPKPGLFETVEGQARMLTRSFRLLAARRDAWNVERVLWYAWQDPQPGQTACGWCHTAGLLDGAGEPRPALAAFTALSGGTPVAPADVRGRGGRSAGGETGGGGILPWIAGAVALVVVGAAGAWALGRRRRAPRGAGGR
jgi:polysaccharide biosynthesis protein PslG